MTIALARRYRPRKFADLLVQDHVAAALRGAVAKDRVGHGYLLTGPRGVGKTTAARILAMALNCERRDLAHPTGEPCGECTSCERVWGGSANLDVVEIDAASNRGVDDARDLRERAMYAASQDGHHKVYIVDEAHMLTREAWNALLKILEEPPPRVVFVFATTEPQKIANTAAPVLSRLQRFDFRRIGPKAIRDHLRTVLTAEQLDAEDDALLLIARYADGGMRDALSVLDQCLSFGDGPVTAERVREVLGLQGDALHGEVLSLVADREPARVFPLVDQLMEAGADLVEFMTGVADLLRAVLVAHFGGQAEELTERQRQVVADAQARLRPEDLLRMLRLLAESETAIRRGAHPRLTVETLLLRWAMLDRIVDLEQVLRAAGGAAGSGGSGGTGAAAGQRVSGTARQRDSGTAGPQGEPPPRVLSPATDPVPFTLAGLQGAWPDLVLSAKGKSVLLGEALAVAQVVAVDPPAVTLEFAPEATVMREGVERQRALVQELIQARVGAAVSVRFGGAATEPDSPAARPRRLSGEALKAEKLERFRRIDPLLDLAATELDLEVIDDSPKGY
ncbi:MAG: DNA polymerase III subunit gamma/tau [Gemmatimonadota bacterium]|nr:DNA polymerase III subunit gamma/tau [Gemmatimonadota bacterium]